MRSQFISFPFLLRKIIHLGTGLIIIGLAEDSNSFLLQFPIFTLITVILDLGRKLIPAWNTIFLRFFGKMLKESERSGSLTAANTLLVGMYLSFLLFPINIFRMAASVAIIADPLAAVGGKIVSPGFSLNRKTVAGSIIFFVAAFLMFWQYWNIPLLPAAFISIILSVMELYSPESMENFILMVGNSFLVALCS